MTDLHIHLNEPLCTEASYSAVRDEKQQRPNRLAGCCFCRAIVHVSSQKDLEHQ